MATISLEKIKKFRIRTGAGINDCKEALTNAGGDEEKAIDYLRQKGVLKSRKRADKSASNGFIFSYVHNGHIGVLVEIVSETDFAAKNERFQNLGKEVALHIAASSPLYVSRETVPADILEREKKLVKEKLKKEGKPENILEKIAEGQMNKFYEETCLLDQAYVRDEKKKIKDLLEEALAAFGEKIEITRFIRMELGAFEN